MTVQSVGIANRDGSDDGVTRQDSLETIAYGLFLRHMAQLEDGGLECRHGAEHTVVTRIHPIEAEAQTTHVKLAFREMLDGGRIIHVAQNLVREGCLQLSAGHIELLELKGREVVEVITVGANEMAEDGSGNDSRLMLQSLDNLINVALWVEAQTMHTSVELDVHWPARDTLLLRSMYQRIHQSEGVHLWFQVVVEHGIEGRHLGVHNHDVLCDAVTTQGDTLVGNCHSQIVNTMVLQRLGHLHRASSIGICLDHAYQFSFWLQE